MTKHLLGVSANKKLSAIENRRAEGTGWLLVSFFSYLIFEVAQRDVFFCTKVAQTSPNQSIFEQSIAYLKMFNQNKKESCHYFTESLNKREFKWFDRILFGDIEQISL
ncbi:hypothetical protein [Belliella baltica]|uniref:hypothetical protein n=1 Tax=Belliella baltica TaxID=232259 RepID=UPI0002F4955F|nr:hypothetical protein [Belliella baltica]